ncbi:hypothetical protein H6P81_017249 [Aristolochia fimbriata]|uniref:Uncharacterized protein n=1 Tax=Aristolochia fimbriata TaxID=158543 RepID=A0AAV7DXM1_ARIFI|nr:hypothetical protein H6P81_017249 [Aristolochia fimbriata]
MTKTMTFPSLIDSRADARNEHQRAEPEPTTRSGRPGYYRDRTILQSPVPIPFFLKSRPERLAVAAPNSGPTADTEIVSSVNPNPGRVFHVYCFRVEGGFT